MLGMWAWVGSAGMWALGRLWSFMLLAAEPHERDLIRGATYLISL